MPRGEWPRRAAGRVETCESSELRIARASRSPYYLILVPAARAGMCVSSKLLFYSSKQANYRPIRAPNLSTHLPTAHGRDTPTGRTKSKHKTYRPRNTRGLAKVQLHVMCSACCRSRPSQIHLFSLLCVCVPFRARETRSSTIKYHSLERPLSSSLRVERRADEHIRDQVLLLGREPLSMARPIILMRPLEVRKRL